MVFALLAGPASVVVAGESPAFSAVKPGELQKLLLRFSSIPGLSAKFREEKHITLLVKPLINEGRIYFAAPKLFARHTDKPEKSVLVIREEDLHFIDPSGSRTLNFKNRPILRLVVDTFSQVLSGDLAALERNYSIGFEGSADDRWKMALTPKISILSRILKEARLEGQETVVESLRVTEANGDISITKFTEVDLSRRYSECERERFFLIRRTR
jgi:outer membrane lipoprotein-sorting protein